MTPPPESSPSVDDTIERAMHARRQGNSSDAKAFAPEAVALAHSAHDRAKLTRASIALGRVERDDGNGDISYENGDARAAETLLNESLDL